MLVFSVHGARCGAARRGVGGCGWECVTMKQAQAVVRVEEAAGEGQGQEGEQAHPEVQSAPDHRRTSRGDSVQVCGGARHSVCPLVFSYIRVYELLVVYTGSGRLFAPPFPTAEGDPTIISKQCIAITEI